MNKLDTPINTREMVIQEVAIDSVTPYEKNPRKIPKEAVDKVAASIREFGFKQPIVVDKDMVIIVGHTRLMAAKKLGYEKVPVLVASDLSPEKARAYRLADNKTNELTDWDFDTLQEELESFLSVEDFNMEDFGFDMSFLDKKSADDLEDDDFEPDNAYTEARDNCHVTLGDIWELGDHRLMCGDSTKEEDVRVLMGGEVADMCVTDPPYNVALGMGGSVDDARKRHRRTDGLVIMNDSMEDGEFYEFLLKTYRNVKTFIKPGGAFYVWHADNEGLNFRKALKDAGLTLRQTIIWNKNSMTLGRQDYQWKHEPCLYGWVDGAPHKWFSDRSQTTVLDFDKPSKSELHPTMKPIPLFAYQIQNSSERGDKVLDLFGGSGTTIMACEQLRRKGYSMEFDPIYCQVIINRWEALTGRKARKIC